MKSKDWSTIIVIIFVSAILSIIVTNVVVGSRTTNKLKVEKITPLTDAFPLPSSTYFNSNSINPTQEIKIGEDSNENPFTTN